MVDSGCVDLVATGWDSFQRSVVNLDKIWIMRGRSKRLFGLLGDKLQ